MNNDSYIYKIKIKKINRWLGNNNFSGPIPEFLENLTKLKYL